MDWREHITVDAGRQGGQPCVRGTRIPVYVILDNLAAGESEEAILAEYPTLTRVHIRAPRLPCALRDRGAPSIRETRAPTVTIPLHEGLFRRNVHFAHIARG